MKVDLTDDAVDTLRQSLLIQDYKMLCEQTNKLEGNKNNLKRYELEDLEHNLRYKDAMEVLMEYYVGFHWRDVVEADGNVQNSN